MAKSPASMETVAVDADQSVELVSAEKRTSPPPLSHLKARKYLIWGFPLKSLKGPNYLR